VVFSLVYSISLMRPETDTVNSIFTEISDIHFFLAGKKEMNMFRVPDCFKNARTP
jgi:hypothetical protein